LVFWFVGILELPRVRGGNVGGCMTFDCSFARKSKKYYPFFSRSANKISAASIASGTRNNTPANTSPKKYKGRPINQAWLFTFEAFNYPVIQ